ncbi:MAG: (d)CMP kinase [Calditrichaeota bacterium]|nr:MAG: (d)CMP kinase [Calditrichota bacterium]
MNKKGITIAIDGPAASGKSTTAREVARQLGYIYIDTGAMYRAVTKAALDNGVDLDDPLAIEQTARAANIQLKIIDGRQHTFLNGRDVSQDIRAPRIDRNITPVATHPGVRRLMVAQQRALARQGGVVMDGRDIGTVVLPRADLKIFMEASIEARAQRRLKEQRERDPDITLEAIKSDLARRDHADSVRSDGPLKKADDAIVIDTSHMTIEEQVATIVKLARERGA